MAVCKWANALCPNCRQSRVQSHNDVGALLANLLTGRLFIGGAKAISILAQGGGNTYSWVDCPRCSAIAIACDNCGHVWQPEDLPVFGNSINCPGCGCRLV